LIGEVKNNPRIHIPIFGNGDVDSPEKAKEARDRYGVDGVMIGRGSIGHPWIFNEVKHYLRTGSHLPEPTIDDKVDAAREHLERSIAWKGSYEGVVEMRRHYGNYFRGLPDFRHNPSRPLHHERAGGAFRAAGEHPRVLRPGRGGLNGEVALAQRPQGDP
jgi:tRNA-dihydrouridine synthase